MALLPTVGQAQTVEWARSAGGVADDRGSDVAVDDAGNNYATGFFGGGKMYWTTLLGSIHRANLDGTGTEDLLSGLSTPNGIALDVLAGKMYWASGNGHSVMRANLDGTSAEPLVTGTPGFPGPISLDVASGKMYWTEAVGDTIVRRANFDGSSIEDLVPRGVQTSPNGIALDLTTGKVYFTACNRIRRANLDGSVVEDIIVTASLCLGDIALDVAAGKIYWADGAPANPKIRRANLDGTAIEDLVTAGLQLPADIALDTGSGQMYWTDNNSGKIQRGNLDGSDIVDLVTGVSSVRGIALDLTGVAFCGDNVVNQPGEECDGMDDTACPGACLSDCTCPICGNGSIDPDEECDDGNTVDGDGCSSDCLREEACCLTDNSCQLIDVVSCAAQGGIAQGPGSTCGGIEACCDSVTGVCYMADRVCCLANGDTPQGPGTACTAPQECCFSNNTCTNLDPLCCVVLGGTPQGSGSTCGTCGDGTCDCDEDFDSCCQDCPCPECTHCFEDCFGGGRVCDFLCVTDCGDGTCDPACENCDTCPVDCACDDCATCNAATGTCDPDCGNGTCQPLCGENCRTCPGDCACDACDNCSVGGSCVSACGDGTCDPSCESCSSCPQDCHECGDGCCTASAGESCCNCAQDCGPCCGNGVCDDLCGEDCSTCPDDCQLPEGEECMPTVTEWGLMALVLLLLIGLAIKFGQYRRVPTDA